MPVRAHRLLVLLDEDPARTWTAKELALATDRKWAATRQALSRLFMSGKIAKPYRGGYQSSRSLVREGPFDPRLRFHGIKLFALSQDGYGGISSRVFQRVSVVWASPANHRVGHTGAMVFYGEWHGRLITTTIYPKNGRIEVWLTSTLKPLNLIELHTFFVGVVPTATDLPPEFWKVQQIGGNIDLPGVTLPMEMSFSFPEGVSCDVFEKGTFRAYQKAQLEAARLEVHLYATDAKAPSVGDFVDNMKGIFSSLESLGGKP